jgi:hypothetical protein
MAAVEPKTVRSILTSRLDRADDPLVLRLFGLGLVGAGAVERVARSAFTHDSNSLTVKYLESRSWTLPKVANDFDYAESDTFDEGDGDDESEDVDPEILLDD